MAIFIRLDMGKLEAAEVGDREFPEDIVEDRGRILDGRVAADQARRLEAREGEGLDELLERHAILQADRHGDGEVVHKRAESGALFVHVEENLAEPPVLILAGVEVNLMPADHGLLDITSAPVWQLFTYRPLALDLALDDPLDDALCHHGGALGLWLVGGNGGQHLLLLVL